MPRPTIAGLRAEVNSLTAQNKCLEKYLTTITTKYDELIKLYEDKEQLYRDQEQIYKERDMIRDNLQKEHERWIRELNAGNEKLKKFIIDNDLDTKYNFDE